jgi:hypothetical protein
MSAVSGRLGLKDGLRVASVVEAGGAFYLRFFNTKHRGPPQEHTIPISPELAAGIREQQE